MIVKISITSRNGIITFLIGAATLIIFVAVVHRYRPGCRFPGCRTGCCTLNMSWAQELCIIMFVWMAKFGAAYGVRTGIHVGVDVLINPLAGRMRAKFIVFGMLAGALFTGIVGTLGAHFVWENGAHYAIFNALGIAAEDLYPGPTTPDLEWPTWIVYSRRSARLVPDVFPLPAGHRELHQDRGIAASRSRPRRRHRGGEIPVDVNPYQMDDELHPHDLKYSKRHPEAKVGADDTAAGDKGDTK